MFNITIACNYLSVQREKLTLKVNEDPNCDHKDGDIDEDKNGMPVFAKTDEDKVKKKLGIKRMKLT